jgi:ribosome-binding protein aMBF1 (putative translation factor)
MKKQARRTSDAIRILHQHFYAGRPERLAALEEARANAEVARELHALRQKAGLTQKQLAALVGTAPSVISRLEDADYEGHSMGMLRRIAAALNRRVEIRFVPLQGKLQAA